MGSSETERLIRRLDAARKEALYYKTIAEQTGKLRLREAETLSLTIQDLRQAKKNLSQEIEERRRVENELRASDAKYRSILESMNDEVYMASPGFVVEYVNPAMIDRIGPDSLGKPCYKAIFGQDEKCPWCPVDHIRKGTHVEYEVLHPNANHSYAVTSTPVCQADGSISTLSIFKDITEKKAIEAELRQARKMESIGILAGGVAHDFNNFLQVIIGCTVMSLEEIPEQSPAYDYLKTIRQSSNRAKGVVRQLLNFSRKAEVKKNAIDLGDVIRDTMKLLKSTIPNTIDIQYHIPDRDLPIFGDDVQISQVLINICTNAYQAMEAAGGLLTVTVDTVLVGEEDVKGYPGLLPGDYAAIEISDTGPGMAPDIVDYIFDPYFTTKEIGKGSGMGLAVVHGIVNNHDGIITVDNRPGQGAAFTILFPLSDTALREEIQSETALQPGNETILFIDDDPLVVKITENILKQLGYSAVCRTDPLDALEVFQTDPDRFDLVITDLIMPGMRGTELYDNLKAIRGGIPTIICTGHSAHADGEEVKKTGVNAFLIKPFSPKELAEAIRNVLDCDTA